MSAEHPRDPEHPHRFLCTTDHPMPQGAPGNWTHPEAINTDSGDEWTRYGCPACGTEFKVTYEE